MNIGPVSGITSVERFQKEILQYIAAGGFAQAKPTQGDRVSIADVGLLLQNLSAAGFMDTRQLVANILADRHDESLMAFLQAYSMVYGYELSGYTSAYNRYGRSAAPDRYEEIKKVLKRYGNAPVPETRQETLPPFALWLGRAMKKLGDWLRS